MSSCSRISASVTVGLSNNVSMWLTARVLYFQNMVTSTGASDRALVCNNTQRLLVSNCWKQTRPVHCVEPEWMQGSCTSTDCRLSCARLPVQSTRVLFTPRCKKYTSTEAVRPGCTRFAPCAFSAIFHGAFRAVVTSLFHYQKSPRRNITCQSFQ